MLDFPADNLILWFMDLKMFNGRIRYSADEAVVSSSCRAEINPQPRESRRDRNWLLPASG